MKKLLVCLAAATLLCSCSQKIVSPEGETLTREQVKTLKAQEINNRLRDRHYKVIVDMMSPTGYPSTALSHEWGISVHDNTIDCYLPYIGRAHMGGAGWAPAFDFTKPIRSYKESHPKEGQTYIEIGVWNDREQFTFGLTVYDNGKAYLMVYPQNRDAIKYTGNVQVSKWMN